MQMPPITAGTMYLAIVLYTLDPLATATQADVVSVSDVSLVRNDFAIDAQPQTADQVLKECQYYYEQSATTLALITGGSAANALFKPMNSTVQPSSTNAFGYSTPFEVVYKNIKRKVPSFTFYNTTAGTSGAVDAYIFFINTGSTFASATSSVTVGSYWSSNTDKISSTFTPVAIQIITTASALNGGLGSSAGIKFHYTCDARIGLV